MTVETTMSSASTELLMLIRGFLRSQLGLVPSLNQIPMRIAQQNLFRKISNNKYDPLKDGVIECFRTKLHLKNYSVQK